MPKDSEELPEFYDLKCVYVSGEDYPQTAKAYELGRVCLVNKLTTPEAVQKAADDIAALKWAVRYTKEIAYRPGHLDCAWAVYGKRDGDAGYANDLYEAIAKLRAGK